MKIKNKTVNLSLIKEKREAKHYSLGQMAKLLHLSNASNYYKYENGQYSIDADLLFNIAQVLREDVKDFYLP